MFYPCFIMQYLVSFLIVYQLVEEERELVALFCVSSSRCHGVICGCDMSW